MTVLRKQHLWDTPTSDIGFIPRKRGDWGGTGGRESCRAMQTLQMTLGQPWTYLKTR